MTMPVREVRNRPARRPRLRVASPGAHQSNGGTARPPDGLVDPLFAELGRQRIPAAIARTEDEEVLVLVTRAHREALRRAAVACGLLPLSSDPIRGDRYAAPVSNEGTTWRVRCVTHLRYGSILRCLSTGEPTERILARRVADGGVPYLAPEDRLVDLALHALLDDPFVPPARRRDLRHLMEDLRRRPVAAGRAAERVQRELSPGISWSALLGDVALDRWDELGRRRYGLIRHLSRRRPLATLRTAARDASRRLRRRPPSRTTRDLAPAAASAT